MASDNDTSLFSLLLFERNCTLSLQDKTDAHMNQKGKMAKKQSDNCSKIYIRRERESERKQKIQMRAKNEETDELERKNIYMKRKERGDYAVHGPLF